jgi:hypothetical protein
MYQACRGQRIRRDVKLYSIRIYSDYNNIVHNQYSYPAYYHNYRTDVFCPIYIIASALSLLLENQTAFPLIYDITISNFENKCYIYKYPIDFNTQRCQITINNSLDIFHKLLLNYKKISYFIKNKKYKNNKFVYKKQKLKNLNLKNIFGQTNIDCLKQCINTIAKYSHNICVIERANGIVDDADIAETISHYSRIYNYIRKHQIKYKYLLLIKKL